MGPKDKDPKLQKSGIIYNYKCPQLNCTEQYIGESGRTLGDRLKEHLRAPSPIHQYSSTSGHPISPNCFKIIHRESKDVSRNIKEAMFIRVNDPSLSRNIGKYQLPHIWDQVLQDTPTLQLPQHYVHQLQPPHPPPFYTPPHGEGQHLLIGKYSIMGDHYPLYH